MPPAVRNPRRPTLVAAGALALAGALLWWLTSGGAASRPGSEAPDDAGGPRAGAAAAETAASHVPPEARRTDVEAGPPATDPAAPPPQDGDGRTGAIEGRVRAHDAALAAVTVELFEGIDRGRSTRTDDEGAFGLADLHPGGAALRFRATSGEVLAERRVVVRHSAVTTFELDATPDRPIVGIVLTAGDVPVAGASVACDGSHTWTDASGRFVLSRTARGTARMLFTHPGLATVDVAAWSGDERTVRMPAAATLEIALPPLDGDSDVQIYLLPTELTREPLWQRWCPRRARAGSTVTLDDLAAADVEVRAFSRTAHARPAMAALRHGARARVALVWQPLPVLTGRVVAHDAAVPDARVRLTAVDQAHAVFVAMGEARPWLRTCAVEPLPAAQQEVSTDRDGRFRLSLPDLAGRALQLEVEHGARRVRESLRGGAAEIVIDLTPR